MCTSALRRAALAAFAVIAVVCTRDDLHGQTASSDVRDAAEYVATLQVYGANGEHLGQGSGFFMVDGRVATNNHVLEGAAWVEVLDESGEFLGSAHHAEAISTRLDLAVLPAVSSRAAGLRLSTSAPDVGDPVWALGSPQGLSGTMSSGIVSAVREYEGTTTLQITAPISPGSSGGPVLDESGRVLGVAVAILETGQNLNFAVPSRYLERLRVSEPGRFDFPAGGAPTRTSASTSDGRRPDSSRELRHGVVREEVLSEDDIIADDLPRMDVFWFEATAGETVRIEVASQAFDTQVFVTRPDSTDMWTADDDDGGDGTNSDLTVTLPHTGQYVVAVGAYADGTGPYRIAFQKGSELRADASEAMSSDRWRPVWSTKAGDEWFIDTESMSSEFGVVRFWTKVLYEEFETYEGASYDSSRLLVQMRCEQRRLRVREGHIFRNGRRLDTQPGENWAGEWMDIIPETLGEQLLKAVCE